MADERRPADRLRRLQRLQFAAVAITAVAIIATSVLIGRSVLATGAVRERTATVERTLVDLRGTLRVGHAEYWRRIASGGRSDLPLMSRAEFLEARRLLGRAAVERPEATPAERAAIDETISAMDSLRAIVFSELSRLPGGATAVDLRARTEGVISRIDRAISEWIDLLDANVVERGRAAERFIDRFTIALGILVAIIVAAGIALWVAIDRARQGAVGEIAAERDATAAVMASVQDGLAVLDPNGKVVDANERLCALAGRSLEHVIGSPPPWSTDVPSGFVGELDLELVSGDGTRRPVILSSSPLASDTGAVGFVHVLKDVTERKRVETELRELAEEREVLRRVATVVAGGAEPTEVFDLVARELAQLLGVEVGSVARFDEVGDRAVDVGVWVDPISPAERPPARVPLDGGAPVAQVFRTWQPVRVEALGAIDETSAELFTACGYVAGVAAPVSVGAARWGAVKAFTTRDGGIPGGAEVRLARFAELVGLTVANADARARLASQAATDPLTGLANHRAFHERLEQEVARARAEDGELALVVFDLDRFKDVNDAFGHQVGDEVLAHAARRLAGEARFGELVARVGGEEFAWILPGSDGINAWRAAERARQAVAASPFPSGVGFVTASAGIADLTQAPDAAALIRLADGALYWAKAHGRNVTLRYSPEVVRELSAAERAERLARSQGVTALQALARAVDAKDASTARHAERVAAVAVRLGSELGWNQERLRSLEEAALVHDVGKIGVPDALLLKPGKLTVEERAEVEVHARLGAEIVSDVLNREQVAWVRSHHERWDGDGYPDGLRGPEIPDGARILAVADAWDAMTSIRVYGAPRSPEAALEEVGRCAGRQFAPDVADALHALWRDRRLTLTEVTGAAER